MTKRTIQENQAVKRINSNTQSSQKEIYLVLDNIRSMHNIGAIFRTADAAGVKKIFLCGITATPPRPQIAKTALNTIDHVQWKYYKSSLKAVQNLIHNNIQIVCLEQTDDSIDYRNFSYHKPLAIIVGNEIEGIRDEIISLSDIRIEIPMHGIANSLNVATATGIALFNII